MWTTPLNLTIAVLISYEVTLSDFITPVEIMAGLNLDFAHVYGPANIPTKSPYNVVFDYISETLDPVVSMMGPASVTINPTMTYEGAMTSGKQFDILWVPAGPLPDPVTGASRIPQAEIDFIAQQAPKAKYVMSVCAGAVQLGLAGVLSGKRATTNKAFFRDIVASTPKDIEWVTHARWVVDGNVWTSSGVSAGGDMALAFVEHLAGADYAHYIRGGVEIPQVSDQDDLFADWFGL
ncbi:class I glutamine amidotransferase-like protein [Mycena rebaudengoi]|nr:class I glutamine amidotransferase-like protein [Mycena rebaudengoi]